MDQIKSKQRVIDYGEVFTPPDIVNAMLDLVKQETERIDSRFLEPACGTGNFLVEILRRKLDVVEKTCQDSQLHFERDLVLAVSSLYGIDILEDNVITCRQRLFNIANERYTAVFKSKTKDACRCTLQYIIGENIIWGNTLTQQALGVLARPIIFAEWSFVGDKIKRRDFLFEELLAQSSLQELPLFSDQKTSPTLAAEYPPVHFLEVCKHLPKHKTGWR